MRGLRIGSVFGVPIQLGISFLLVLPLLAYVIGVDIESSVALLNAFGAEIDPSGLSAGSTPWLLGLAAAIGLFGGVLVHEIGHTYVALRLGHAVDSITLWLLGGLARLSSLPDDPTDELAIALAGPAASVGVGIGTYLGFLLVPAGFHGTRFLLGYLALLNLVLAIFNMIPAYPMDGGRALRAALARGRSYVVATKWAAAVGRAVAFTFGALGLYVGNLLIVGLAVFLFLAATSEARRVSTRAALASVSVRELAIPPTIEATPDEREAETGAPAIDPETGTPATDPKTGAPATDPETGTSQLTAETEAPPIHADTDALSALSRMQEFGVDRLVVVDNGGEMGEPEPFEERLIGTITRSDLSAVSDSAWERGAGSDSETGR